MLKKINMRYIRLALSASLVNRVDTARDPEEGRFYQRIKQSMPAPQGVGVINSGGEVLDWVLTFESQAACHEFFDYGLKRFREYPALERPVATRRYQPYPNGRREDFKHVRPAEPIADRHPKGVVCPATAAAKSRARKGDVAVRIFGRVLGKDGKPLKEAVRQEDYSQDHFLISNELQEELARALGASRDRVEMPERLSQQIITYAYLSHMDVRPLENPRGGKGEIKSNTFWLRRSDRPGWWRVEGKSDVQGELQGRGGHEHAVRLEWNGYLRMEGGRMTRIVLGARGTEKLKYGRFMSGRGGSNRDLELKSLPAGRPIDLDAPVRYGVIGATVEADQVRAGEIGKGNETGRDGQRRGRGGPSASLQQKMQRIMALVQNRVRQQGADFQANMQEFQKLAQQGKFDEAEEILDKVLTRLGEDPEKPGAPTAKGPTGSLGEKMKRFQARVQERQNEGGDLSALGPIMQRFQKHMREGDREAAEKVLDEALKTLDGEAPERTSGRAEVPSLPETSRTPEELKADIEALRVDKVAWRQIDWRICLLKGLKESRAQKKPVILWIFIDRPIDDERC